MKVKIDGEYYEVVVVRKRIKNIYMRVKDDLKIYVSVNSFVSDSYVKELIDKNINILKKMIDREKRKIERSSKFFYLGNEYRVILCNVFSKPYIDEGTIYVRKEEDLDKFLKSEAKRVLPLRVEECYKKMNNKSIPYPKVNVRKMVRKWGYCNKRDKLVTLNSELIKYNIDDIDYVVVHELCHFLHFDHSKAFWESVKYYKPDYKVNRKHLREE